MTAFANHSLSPFRFKDDANRDFRALRPDAVPDKHRGLFELAQLVDSRTTVHLSLSLLWRELTRGLCKVVDGFFTPTRCLLVTTPTASAVPFEGRRLRIVESILCGVGQKSVAIEMNLAPSTVALNARLALESLGIYTKPSRVHPLVMLSAVAARSQDPTATGALSYLTTEPALRVISIRRPDAGLELSLPPAELAVIRCLVEGASYEEIARRRGTSTRTIANQITAVFRRLRVSGRSELLLRLFAEERKRFSAAAPLMRASEVNVLEGIVD